MLKKLTQQQLADLTFLSVDYICEIERGGSISSLATISKIAQTLNISLDYLVFGINKNNSDTMFSEILESLLEENHQLYEKI